MIMEDTVENEVTMSGGLSTGKFTIRESAKAFSILSSSLYSNKIKAIIRELSCNARDSHVEAGKPTVPFYVHLPTRMEPEFVIRDYGTGLSHEQVMILYTTYFESTKTNSNQFVGALGLGSKSPFSYTSNFTITSTRDNSRGVYSAYIDDLGVPSIVNLLVEETTEENGVEIRIPVSAADMASFLYEAKEVYQWFDVKPTTNVTLYFQGHPTKSVHGDFTELTYNSKSIFLMGGVAYPFDMVGCDQSAAGINLLIKGDIGSVDVLPSREGLQMTQKTKDFIKGEYTKIRDTLEQTINSDINSKTCKYDKVARLNSYNTNSRLLESIKVKMKLSMPSNIELSYLEEDNFSIWSYNNSSTKKKHKVGRVSISENTKFIFNDTSTSMIRIKETLKARGEFNTTYYVFSILDKKEPYDIAALKNDTLLGANIINASTILVPKLQSNRTKAPKYCGAYILEKKIGKWGQTKNKWVPVLSVPSTARFYIKFSDKASTSVDKPGSFYNSISTNDIANCFDINEIIGIRESDTKIDVSSLTEFFTHIDKNKGSTDTFDFSCLNYSEIIHVVKRLLLLGDDFLTDDQELNDLVSDYNKSIQYKDIDQRNVKKLVGMYEATFDVVKKDYPEKIITALNLKYNIIGNSSCDETSPQLLKSIVNSIHNHKE